MAILDVHGRPIEMAALPEPQSARITRYMRPWIDPALGRLAPREVASRLRAADDGDLWAQHRLFADMEDRDAHIAAEMQKRSLAVARLPWTLEAPPEASAAEQDACQGCLELLTSGSDALEDAIVDLLGAVGHGFVAIELSWQKRGSMWLPRLLPRPQEWFMSSGDGREILLADDGGLGQALRPFGWIMHQPRRPKTGYLARGGMYRALVWPFVYKSYAVGDFAEFLETYGLPFVIGKYGRDASEDDKARLLAAVSALSHDARAIMPVEMQLEIHKLTASGDGGPHLAMINWADAAISRAIVGQTLSATASGTGLGSGVADLQGEVRRDIRDADARQLAGTLTRDLIWPLCALNFGLGDARRCPRLVFDCSHTEDITTYADALPKLVNIGLAIPARWAARQLGIPEPQGDEPVLGPLAQPGAAPMKAALVARNGGTALLKGGDYSGAEDDPTPVSAMAERLDTEAAPAWETLIAAIMTMVDEAQSLQQLRDQLLGAFGDLDAGQLADVMAMAMAAAHLAGRYQVDVDSG